MHRFVGVVGGGKLNWKAMVQFAWHLAVGELDDEHTVQVRCGDACARGISLPEKVQEKVKEKVKELRLEKAASDAMVASQSAFGDEVKLACRLCATSYIACAHHEFAQYCQVCRYLGH